MIHKLVIGCSARDKEVQLKPENLSRKHMLEIENFSPHAYIKR